MKRFVIPLLLTFATFATILINGLANFLPFNSVTTAAVSDSYPVLFTPSGYVFSIWGVIYLGLVALCVYSWVAPRSKQFTWVFTRWYLIASLANSMWLILWHYYQIGITVVIMLILLVSVIRLYTFTAHGKYKNLFERLAKRTVLSLYLGWISVATIANISVYLYSIGWDGAPFPQVFWAAALIMVAAAFAMTFLKYERNIVYPLVILWAITGIALKYPENGILTLSVLVAIFMIGWVWIAVSRQLPGNVPA